MSARNCFPSNCTCSARALERACAVLRDVLDAERVELTPWAVPPREARASSRICAGGGPVTNLAGRVVQSGESVGPLAAAGERDEALAIARRGVVVASAPGVSPGVRDAFVRMLQERITRLEQRP